MEALENLPEDVSRDKTRAKIAVQNREENFRPKTILPWGVRYDSYASAMKESSEQEVEPNWKS